MRGSTSKLLLSALIIFAFIPVFALAQTGLVNINTASLAELKTLNGIGDVKAQAIIDYRTSHGSFLKIEDIKNVSGIGDATYNNIKSFITVGNVVTQTETNTEATTTSSTTPETTPTITVVAPAPTTSSVHYSASPAGVNKSQAKVSLGIGRDRIGAVGSPLEFRVETDMNYTRSTTFKWNFGDGSEGAGEVLSHTYLYPGEYVVVLNAVTPAGQAVARLNAKIIEPDLMILSATPERIEVKNNAKQEVSLFGRALMAEGKVFLFPQDTIVKAGQSLYFDTHVTGLAPSSLSSVALIVTGDKRMDQDLRAIMEEEKVRQMTAIEYKIGELQDKLAEIAPRVTPAPVVEASVPEVVEKIETATALNSLSATSSGKISRWFGTLKHFFLRKP